MYKIHCSHTYHFSHLVSCHFLIVPVNICVPKATLLNGK